MPEAKMQVLLPALPAPKTLNDPRYTVLTADGHCLLSYDPATQAGLIYQIQDKRWSITAPIPFEDFASMLVLSGYSIVEGLDAERWMRACRKPTRTAH